MGRKNKNKKDNKEPIKQNFPKAKNFDEKLVLLLKMLEYNTPHGHEEHMHQFLPKGGKFDSKGNYILTTDENSKTLFCCHMDTVGRSKKEAKPIYENGWIRVGNKDAHCLGGDDRCGMLCLITLIEHKVPGTYIFHIGEERGLIGAHHVQRTFELKNFDRAVEFDRKAETSVITEMGVTRTCSDDFAEALCKELGMGFEPDDTGVSTDVRAYEDEIPECTNISVGYRSEHSTNETINADFLINGLLPAIVKVDWEKLPTKRDPKANNRRSWSSSGYSVNYSHGWHNHGGHSSRHWEDDYLWKDYHTTHDERYRSNTVDSFTNHSKILRQNGIIIKNGDLINDSEYIECELCNEAQGPFSDINIAGTDFLLCKDCCSFLVEGWDPEEYDAESELSEELDLLMLTYGNSNIEEEEDEELNNE